MLVKNLIEKGRYTMPDCFGCIQVIKRFNKMEFDVFQFLYFNDRSDSGQNLLMYFGDTAKALAPEVK